MSDVEPIWRQNVLLTVRRRMETFLSKQSHCCCQPWTGLACPGLPVAGDCRLDPINNTQSRPGPGPSQGFVLSDSLTTFNLRQSGHHPLSLLSTTPGSPRMWLLVGELN